MKKILVLAVLGAALVASLTACGGAKETSGAAATADAGAASGAQEITIKATNFQFDQKEYHVKKGQPVKLTLSISQGMHGVAIKDLDVKLEGNHKSVTFTPDKAGTFPLECSIMCGTGHGDMKAALVVE
ncbi:cupredoxin domain-containing protein [Paenibacillus athensensis]|uniref:Cytochrome oxidase subunit II copper A binding domain-containing protein n=1 Tax=Paenibacillus athensensis TaxID=1967502 RepID=A0A4Y8PXS8_9BACL|nr:cupredoxin domain-containing protein [Paenibacillus athensensis]MCD1259317.1 cupredoxin domain-containing protein [Paenibacillus athensensis]